MPAELQLTFDVSLITKSKHPLLLSLANRTAQRQQGEACRSPFKSPSLGTDQRWATRTDVDGIQNDLPTLNMKMVLVRVVSVLRTKVPKLALPRSAAIPFMMSEVRPPFWTTILQASS